MASKEDQIVIVDGYSFLFRAYFSMPPLTNPEGTPVGAVYGFTSMIMRLLKDVKPSHIVIVFDSGKKNFRHDLYKEYKANRPEAPEDLIPQFPLVRDAAEALNIKVLEQVGYEADDVIATLAKRAVKNKDEVLIVSSDKDLMQLINPHIKMYDAIRTKNIGPKEVEEKWGVPPELMLDMLAMVGDSSDNIPGLPGIGPKTAASLLQEYGSWSKVFESSSQIKQNKRREIIENGKDIVTLSKSLVKLKDDLELDCSFVDLRTKKINEKLLNEFLNKHNFKSLIARAKKDFDLDTSVETTESTVSEAAPKPQKKTSHKKIEIKSAKKIEDVNQLKSTFKNFADELKIAVYFQTNFTARNEVRSAKDVSACVISSESQAVYVPVGDVSSGQQRSLLDGDANASIPLDILLKLLEPILADTAIKKVIYDVKSFLHVLKEFGLEESLKSYDDLMLMSYSAGSGRMNYDFDNICKFYLNESDPMLDIGGITKSHKKLTESEENFISEYYANKAQFHIELHDKLTEELFDNKKFTIYQRMELPLVKVLFLMEKYGIKIDSNALGKLSKEIETRLAGLEKEIFKLAGKEFNVASPKQLSEVLFTDMNIEPPKKSKTGAHSTGVEVLEKLSFDGHTIADHLLEWRSIYKLKTTYTDALPKQISKVSNRVHTHFAQAVTSTGRLSSSEPNLQNIPIRSEMGQQIRKTFVAEKGKKIISADYSQIELRILAHIADIKSLKDAFNQGLDIHKATASEVFDIPLGEVTNDLRHKAKAINFGIIYGLSAFGLAKNIDISRGDAAKYIEKYFAEYPGIKEYMDQTIKSAKTHGFVETLFGRRCYIKYINDKNYSLRSFAERAAINAPIQGSNADIIKKAMNKIANEIGFADKCKMLLQIHDELLFEVNEDIAEKSAEKIAKIMENVVNLSVPVKVEYSIGDSWKK
ncbi:MAG: DNA polymerase I [Rickettsiales bacterium]